MIQFPFSNQDKIEYIECGGEHLFAKTTMDEIYGWGRNDEGQLGVGFLTEKVVEPMFINDISYRGIKQISCGDNYSAALNIYGEVFVVGSLEGGKLGLGKGQRRGFQLNFRSIPNLPEIDYLHCGVSHMLAISRYNPDADKNSKQLGKTYAWGKNLRGQLGIGNKENQYSPCVIPNTKERFRKVQCGSNFSLGLSNTNRVYFWGNYKYFCNSQHTKDIEEPRIISALETVDVVDISCEYKYVAALIDKGEIRKWGKYLMDKQEKNEVESRNKKQKDNSEEDHSQKILHISKFPASSKFNTMFSSLITGANHTCAISMNKQVYAWGHNNLNNRLGVESPDLQESAQSQPTLSHFLQQVIEVKKESALAMQAQKGNMLMEEESFEEDKQEIESQKEKVEEPDAIEPKKMDMIKEDVANQPIQAEIVQEQPKKEVVKPSGGAATDITTLIINEISYYRQMENKQSAKGKKKQHIKDLNIFDQSVDLFALECIRQELHQKEIPLIIPIVSSNTSIIEMNIILQKIIKREEAQNQDEKSIIAYDQVVKDKVQKLLKQIVNFAKLQKENKELVVRAKGNLIGRLTEPPFKIDSSNSFILKEKGLKDGPQSVILKDSQKSKIQKVLTFL